MARPTMSPEERRESLLRLRFRDDERAELQKAADSAEIPLARWAREVLLLHARELAPAQSTAVDAQNPSITSVQLGPLEITLRLLSEAKATELDDDAAASH